MKIKIVLSVDEKDISQIDWNTDNEFLAKDIDEILNSKAIPTEKIKDTIRKILKQYKD